MTLADNPSGTMTWTEVETVTTPPCLVHSGFTTRSTVIIDAADPASLRNAIARNTRNPAMNAEKKSAGTESRNHAERSVPRTAKINPHVVRVASTGHGTSTRSSISAITRPGVISLISASLVRIIRCMRTRGASSFMSSGMT
ncbi:MAG: hypothetical protein A4E37_01089 [Methanoregulaceae archaeon PtaB.Bin056]|nr:MAG: hypothetical protein A4E37_01089 [Methanoregulaceae archaeon PtaB.Bin056]